MAIDVQKITISRKETRNSVDNSGATEVRYLHEMRLIADTLEAMRGELAMIGNLLGSMATQPPPK